MYGYQYWQYHHNLFENVILLQLRQPSEHEIQGTLAIENSFNKEGLDHVVLVKIASAAVASKMLGHDHNQLSAVISNAIVDGQSLRTYRHFPNTGTRKSWAAGDASARGVKLAFIAEVSDEHYPSAISAKTWGFNDVEVISLSISILESDAASSV